MYIKKLTEEQRENIKRTYDSQDFGFLNRKSREFNVSASSIRGILKREGLYKKRISNSKEKKGYNINNLLNKKFGKLKVISLVGSSKKSGISLVYWLCECECGVTRDIPSKSLVSGNTKSCGCSQKNFAKTKLKSYNRLPDGEASFNSLYKNLERRALKKQIDFDIPKDIFKILTKKNCYYCGVEPKQTSRNRKDSTQYIYNGLDRIDNNLGYTLDNVTPCCGRCNRMKNILTQDFFISHISKIYNNLLC
jgi:hypothetical protein